MELIYIYIYIFSIKIDCHIKANMCAPPWKTLKHRTTNSWRLLSSPLATLPLLDVECNERRTRWHFEMQINEHRSVTKRRYGTEVKHVMTDLKFGGILKVKLYIVVFFLCVCVPTDLPFCVPVWLIIRKSFQ